MKHAVPSLRRRGKMPCSDINLKGLVQQLWLCQLCIALLSKSHELVRGDTGFEMLVLSLVVLHAHPRHGRLALLWRIVMTGPDLDVVR